MSASKADLLVCRHLRRIAEFPAVYPSFCGGFRAFRVFCFQGRRVFYFTDFAQRIRCRRTTLPPLRLSSFAGFARIIRCRRGGCFAGLCVESERRLRCRRRRICFCLAGFARRGVRGFCARGIFVRACLLFRVVGKARSGGARRSGIFSRVLFAGLRLALRCAKAARGRGLRRRRYGMPSILFSFEGFERLSF